MYDAPKQIKNQIIKLCEREGFKSFRSELKEAQKDLEKFVGEYGKYIDTVRNNTAGHKDEKVIKQIGVIENIEWSTTIDTTNQFEKLINGLGGLFFKLIDAGKENLGKAFNE